MRESSIWMKLNPLKDVLTGKRVVLVVMTTVRGRNQPRSSLRDAGRS